MRVVRFVLYSLIALALLATYFNPFADQASMHDARLMSSIYSHLRETNVIRSMGTEGEVIVVTDSQFYYRSTSAFTAANPDCCEFVTKDRQNMSIPIWLRITGRVASFVRVSYRPTDQAGALIADAKRKVRWLEVSRDGEIQDRRVR